MVVFNTNTGFFRISSDLFELLPETELDCPEAKAVTTFAHHFSNRVYLLVSAETPEATHKATETLATGLKATGLFEKLVHHVSPHWLEAVSDFYYPYRFQLLSPYDQQLSANSLGRLLLEQSWQILTSPSGLVSSEQFIHDPLFVLQRFLYFLQDRASNIISDDGYLQVYQDGRYYNLVAGMLEGNIMSLNRQKVALPLIESAITAAVDSPNDDPASGEGVRVIRSGMIFHGAASAALAKWEISIVFFGAVMVIVLLMLVLFRSPLPLALCLLSLMTGVSAGYTFTVLAMGEVHLFALIFATGFIGASAQFVFLVLCQGENQNKRMSFILSVLLMLLVSLLGVVPFVLLPFPVFKQLAMFSLCALMASCLTVMAVYPVVIGLHKKTVFRPLWLVDGINRLFLILRKLYSKQSTLAGTFFLFILCTGLSLLQFNNSESKLSIHTPELDAADQSVRDILGDYSEHRFYLAQGSSPEQLLQRVEQLAALLVKKVDTGDLKSFRAISEFLPSQRQQQLNKDKLTVAFDRELLDFLMDLTVAEDIRQQIMATTREPVNSTLTPDLWLQGPLVTTHGYLWLGKIGDRYFSEVLLSGVSPEWNPEPLAAPLEGIMLVDKRDEAGDVLGRYRWLMSWLLLIVYGLAGLLLAIRYSLTGMINILGPSLLASGITVAVLGLMGQAVHLFHILALFMILGVSLGYALLLYEAKGQYHRPLIGVTLSMVVTLLSAGLMSFSGVAAVSDFSVTLLGGALLSYLLLPLVIMPSASGHSVQRW